MKEIESAAASTIVDSDSAGLVAEMHAKRRMWRLWPWILVLGITGLIVTLNSWRSAPAWFTYPWLAAVGMGTLVASVLDQIRKTTVLMYDFEPGAGQGFEDFQAAFDGLMQCARAWHVSAEGRVKDKKYHAGASSLISRKRISLGRRNPPYVKTNVAVPFIPVGKQTLYFLPDLVLVFEPNGVGAVSYGKLSIESAHTRFIEDEGVPSDSKVVDRTWRYVNKGGGPDRRFKDNKELPIALYGELTLSSETGLNEVIHTSRTGVSERLIEAMRALG